VGHPKPLLFIDDYEPQVLELNVARENPMSPYEHIHAPGLHFADYLTLLLRRPEPGEQLDAGRKSRKSRSECLVMLIRKDSRWSKHRNLLSVHDCLECVPHRHLGLSITDVATKEAVHRRRRLHVLLGIRDRLRLIARQLIRECLLEFLLPRRIATESM